MYQNNKKNMDLQIKVTFLKYLFIFINLINYFKISLRISNLSSLELIFW